MDYKYEQDVVGPSKDIWKDCLTFQDKNFTESFSAKKNTQTTSVNTHLFDFKTNKPITITFASDLHIGDMHTDYQAIIDMFEAVSKQENHYIYIGGDAVNNFIVSKLAHAGASDILTPEEQWLALDALVTKYKSAVLAIGHGNHDAWTNSLAQINPKSLMKLPTITIKNNGGYLIFKIGDITYRLAVFHKLSGGSVLNRHSPHKRLYNMSGMPDLDIVVQEHFHSGDKETWWAHGKKRYALNTGTFKLVDAYAESLGYDHSSNDTPTLVLYPKERKIVDFDSYKDAIIYNKGA